MLVFLFANTNRKLDLQLPIRDDDLQTQLKVPTREGDLGLLRKASSEPDHVRSRGRFLNKCWLSILMGLFPNKNRKASEVCAFAAAVSFDRGGVYDL